MLKQPFLFINGKIHVRVIGNNIEALINCLVNKQVKIWSIQSKQKQECTFWMYWHDVNRLRKVRKEFNCKVYFGKRNGLPTFLQSISIHLSFLITLLCAIGLFLFLTNITWSIEINGADLETEDKIKEVLQKTGIEIGRINHLKHHPEIIQAQLTKQIENVTWVGVDINGTNLALQVVQKNQPEEKEIENLGHLIAKKKAVISHYFVEKGETIVKKNQFVNKGDMLVSGLIQMNEEKEKLIAAKGEVWGITWYHSEVSFPLLSSYEVITGEFKQKLELSILNQNIPLWGRKDKFKDRMIETEQIPFTIGRYELPIKIIKKTIWEKELMEQTLPKNIAVEQAKQVARNDLFTKIPKDSVIDKEFILHEEVENGKVKLSVNFQVIENIAVKKPIVQGDKE